MQEKGKYGARLFSRGTPVHRVGLSVLLVLVVLVFSSCGKDARVGKDCSVDDQCAPDKGVYCIGADGVGFGICGCDQGSSWQPVFGKCIEDGFFAIKVGIGAEEDEVVDEKQIELNRKNELFAERCQEIGDCDSGLGLECVVGRCLCHPPGDTTVSWFWSKMHPQSRCRVQSAKRHFGAKMVCDKNQPNPGEYYIPVSVWWDEKKARCRSLKERRKLHKSGDVKFTDWGEAMRDLL